MKAFNVVLFFSGLAAFAAATPSGNQKSHCGASLQSSLFSQLFLQPSYDKNFPDLSDDGSPIKVEVNIAVTDYVFDERSQQLEVNIYFRQNFQDSRLIYSAVPSCSIFKYLQLTTEPAISAVYLPDTAFSGILSELKHQMPYRINQYVRVYPNNGLVSTSNFISLTIPCYKNAQGFTVCEIVPEMYSSVISEVVLKFAPTNAIQLDDVKVKHNRHILQLQDLEEGAWDAHTGIYSRLIARFLVHENPLMATTLLGLVRDN